MLKPLTSLVAALFAASLPNAGAAEPLSLAAAAERFVERSTSLPEGSVRAQSIDRQMPLGDCPAGWEWSFPYEARTTVQVSCTASPIPSKRFVAVRYLVPETRAQDRAPSAGAMRRFVVAARDLGVGAVLRPEDLEVVSVPPRDRAFSSTLSDPETLVGLALTRPVRRGESLGRADARNAVAIKRNSVVAAWSSFPGGRVVTKLTAMQSGKVGDWIDAENPQTGRRLRGLVQADGTLKMGGGAPDVLAQGTMSRAD
ncbi:MAG: flagella basal body P-ring formation protein FlgA [Gammaproteobacteria bacterium]|nr:flagella basal body P-ring formation protein FlgA [Gammaproteobacteria bacterium]